MQHAPVGLAEIFRSSTGGHIVDLLRCGPMTADQLAVELGLTNKAVRAQLASLERDGFVRRRGRTRSGKAGKPAAIFEFNPAAEGMFCSGYAPVLIAAMHVLADGASPRARKAALRRIGVDVARSVHVPRANGFADRLTRAAALLAAWGGMPVIDRADGTVIIRSCGCPVSSAVRAHPETCIILEAALSELLHVPVRERCDRSNNPACRFEVQSRERPVKRRKFS